MLDIPLFIGTTPQGEQVACDCNDGFYEGDSVTVGRHDHGMSGRIMALAEGYAMVRYPRRAPFVVPISELTRVVG